MNKKRLISFPQGCVRASFLRRYKRFTVEAQLGDDILLAHTNNTGTMLGLLRPGSGAILSPALNPKRKLKWTLECLDFHGTLVGVNTGTPNKMLEAAWNAGHLPELAGYDTFKREAKVGDSRLDGYLTGPQGECWVECKNVTLVEDDVARFPDAVTERGRKHLHELMRLANTGVRVALFFLIQRADGNCFGPADFIDPAYAETFHEAMEAGVEVWPYVADVTEQGIDLGRKLEVVR